MIAKVITAPTRIELEKLGLDFRTIKYLENLSAFTTESVDDTDTLLNLLSSNGSVLKMLLAELFELKKKVEDLDNRDL
jgi:hypothetical protein